ncbi:DUF305 domain-containing protein [Yinghuangia sp. YIM S09857]|uniref:DUF305 domain-containing protein n=1 Tax=Yinghuangia sp. YIM S09857 TaxID=3436929 RepID=UPI003F531412
MLGVPVAEVKDPPADTSVEAGFARDMKVHHAQAVAMSFTIRDLTDDESVRMLAYDIAATQQNQIGQMTGWLDLWGLTQTTTRPPMEWMSPAGMAAMGGHTMAPGATVPGPAATTGPGAPQMPGMATKAQLDRLAGLRGVEAEVLFLQLMITHHQAGVAMAQDALDHARSQVVRDLAKGMVAGQNAEIAQMRQWLAERGA